MDYMICWSDDKVLENTWEIISGEDAMQIRVSELCDSGIQEEDIHAFEMENELA